MYGCSCDMVDPLVQFGVFSSYLRIHRTCLLNLSYKPQYFHSSSCVCYLKPLENSAKLAQIPMHWTESYLGEQHLLVISPIWQYESGCHMLSRIQSQPLLSESGTHLMTADCCCVLDFQTVEGINERAFCSGLMSSRYDSYRMSQNTQKIELLESWQIPDRVRLEFARWSYTDGRCLYSSIPPQLQQFWQARENDFVYCGRKVTECRILWRILERQGRSANILTFPHFTHKIQTWHFFWLSCFGLVRHILDR